MARDRQRAKQRQAERRARRLEAEESAAPEEGAAPEAAAPEGAAALEEAREEEHAPEGAGSADLAAVPPREDGQPEPHLAAGATSEHLGEPGAVIEDEPDLDDDDEELEDYDFEDEEQPLDGDDAYAPRGRRGDPDAEPDKKRPRVIQFLMNCWAELQRVEWPKRQQLITLTWVVIGFVILAGGFLGLLDAIFSQLVQALL